MGLQMRPLCHQGVLFIVTGMVIIGALIAAINPLPQDHTMPADLAVAIPTTRREGAHRTFKAIEVMRFPSQPDFETLRVRIPTYFAAHILRYILEVTHNTSSNVGIFA